MILATGLAVLAFALWEIRRPGAQSGATGGVLSFLLVNLNIVLLLLLVFLVVRNLLRLFIDRRRNVPGSHLRTRTVLAFLAVALFPATVMLLVSLEFSTNTIDGWFSREVETSLRGAWRLARTYYADSAEEAATHARVLSRTLAGPLATEGADAANEIERRVAAYQLSYGLGTVQVLTVDGRVLVTRFNDEATTGLSFGADDGLLDETLAAGIATRVERLGHGDVVRGSAVIAAPVGADGAGAGGDPLGVVIVDKIVEDSVRGWSESILESFREYRRLALNKRPFKNLYVLTMALASLVVVFSATWLGLYLARGITEPIGRLSEATRRVAEGDWDVTIEETGGDEIGTLVRAFNSMTGELRTTHEALDERRRYIESILANIDAGVVSMSQDGLVATVNPAAVSLLGLREDGVIGRAAAGVFERAGYPEIQSLVADVAAGRAPSGTHRNVSREEEARTLVVTAAGLVLGTGESAGVLVFVEDVSQIVGVQRAEAWKEVARRIAHEIKNPLTPIQLSAQRLQRRLRDRLDGPDTAIVDECVNTIVSEVDELKRLVNEFSQFARRSGGEKRPHDLNQIVEETMPLFTQSRPDIELRFDAGASLPLVVVDRDAIKRALVNLLDNAMAAVGSGAPDGEADVVVRTSHDPELSRVILEVADTGTGIATEHRARVLEPYFSTKQHGTGLGLAIVASVAADHRAYLRYHENEPRGTRFVVEFPADDVAARQVPGGESAG
jgi:two-component system nitrogen regulation sensor histidine kinase NtrY